MVMIYEILHVGWGFHEQSLFSGVQTRHLGIADPLPPAHQDKGLERHPVAQATTKKQT